MYGQENVLRGEVFPDLYCRPGRADYGDIDSASSQTVTNDDCIQVASHRQTVYRSRQ